MVSASLSRHREESLSSPRTSDRSSSGVRCNILGSPTQNLVLRLPFPGSLMNIVRRHVTCWLARTVLAVIVGTVLASGCVARRTSGSTSQAASPSAVLVDAALAEDVLACAEEQFRTAGYATHRDVRTPRVIRAERDASPAGDAYELNVAGAALSSVDGNPNELKLSVSAETRSFRSRDYNAGYELRSTPRGDVLQVTRSVMVNCAKK